MQITHKWFIALVALTIFNFNITHGKVIYVDVDAVSGSRNGVSWQNAFTRLDSAIMVASNGDSIWVAEGRYFTFGTRNAYFNIQSGRKYFGGFKGTEVTFSERDLANYKTYLDGDIGTKGLATDNTSNVVIFANAGSSTELNGFYVVNGYSSTNSLSSGGGGIRMNTSSPNILNCIVEDNHAYMRGGAVYIEGSGQPKFNNCLFRNNNTANDVNSIGGAMFINSGSASFYDCQFIENTSNYGGALGLNANAYLYRCKVMGNLSAVNSGAAVHCSSNGSINAYNTLFAGNHSEQGSIIYMSSVFNTFTHNIINCTFTDNKVSSTTSSTLSTNSNMNIWNSVFWNNVADVDIKYSTGVIEPDVSNCIVKGFQYGQKIISKDPRFVNPGDPQQAPFDATLYDYSVKPGSPAVDAGDSSYLQSFNKQDIDKGIRIRYNNADIGAYESGYAAWVIVAQAGPFGSASGGGSYPQDSVVKVLAIPTSCSVFKRWMESGIEVSTDSAYTFTITGNRTLVAEFTRKSYAVTGSVLPNPTVGTISNLGVFLCSDTLKSVTAVPAHCYRFKEWRENNVVISTTPVYTFLPKQKRDLTAIFELSSYTMVASVSPANSGTVSGNGKYTCDSSVILQAKPLPGYKFVEWKENNTRISTDSILIFVASKNRTLSAIFSSLTQVSSLDASHLPVFPNPAAQTLYVRNLEMQQFAIFNSQGLLMLDGSINNGAISLGALAPGLYFLELQSLNGSNMSRIMFIKE